MAVFIGRVCHIEQNLYRLLNKLTTPMIVRDACPACGSSRFKKNGHTHNGKQQHQCKACPRQFVQCAEHYRISEETRALIERLLRERISLRGICRAVGVGLKWLLGFIVNCFKALPNHLHVQPITGNADVMIQRLEVEADEMSSFVQKKANKHWIWLAMDTQTRQIIAVHVSDRSRKSARRLWAKIPEAYRQQATFYTNQSVVYEGVIPAAQHKAIHKLARKTNHVERFNNPLRQRGSWTAA